jgi:hypothetical protein
LIGKAVGWLAAARREIRSGHPDVLADELVALIQAMGKGPYLVLCAALRAVGGEITIDPDELAKDALRLPPRVEVDTSGAPGRSPELVRLSSSGFM